MAKSLRESNFDVRLSPKSLYYANWDENVDYLKYLQNTDVIINAAGPSNVNDSMLNASYYIDEPLRQAIKLHSLISALPQPMHIFVLSTAAVYGNKLDIKESDLTNPQSPYASGRLFADQFWLNNSLSESDKSISVLRLTSGYSNFLENRVLGRIKHDLKYFDVLELGGTGSEIRDFFHTSDLSTAISRLMMSNHKESRMLNFGSGVSLTIAEVAQIAQVTLSKKYKAIKKITFSGEQRPGNPQGTSLNINALEEFGISPQILPRVGLGEYFEN